MELLVVGGETRLDRTKSLIYFEGLGNSLEFGVADDVLAATKRDRVQHPFLEDLYNWSKSIYHFRFGSNLGKDRFVRSLDDIKVDGDFSMKTTEEVLEAFLRGEKIVTDFEQIVRADMERIGYKLESIGPEKVQFLPINIFGLAVKEADLWTNTHQFDMSQGMFRALSLLIQLNLSLAIKTPSCILIDDIGEGLDFDRSKSLIALIIEKVKGSKVQLIMTTNDRFVMNNVPIEYWCVIQRKGNQSLFYNYKNSKATFDEFVYTGLNNFDFFATGFFEKGFEEFTASAK
ncbi:MAG: AAA family ATPase [Bacteroidia bacterium]